MEPVIVVVVLLAALAVLALWAVLTARRLDRLHIRLDRAHDGLGAALDRRMAVVAALWPPLAPAAREAESIGFSPVAFHDRLQAERHVLDQLPTLSSQEQAAELARADERVGLALRLYNDAVSAARAVRLKPGVRALRLAGTAPMPEFCPQPPREIHSG
nr:Uncharacterised protein [Streptococcus thermophilus]